MIIKQFWGESKCRRCMATCCRRTAFLHLVQTQLKLTVYADSGFNWPCCSWTASLCLHVESLRQSLSSAISFSVCFFSLPSLLCLFFSVLFSPPEFMLKEQETVNVAWLEGVTMWALPCSALHLLKVFMSIMWFWIRTQYGMTTVHTYIHTEIPSTQSRNGGAHSGLPQLT